ncbi:MAG: dockerin type I repeat-containing protein, partial [Chthoniobacterales bacterium]
PLGPQPPNDVAQQFYVGMSTDDNAAVKFEWGVVATQVVGLAVGVPTETELGQLPGSSFSPDGTITLVIPKSLVGNPQAGDLLGAVNGRTFTGDTSQTVDLERSTLLVDHTFVKAQRDNGEPAATYTIVGNTTCPAAGLVPISAVSRKTHGSQGDYDVTLPLIGNVGVEPRLSPNNAHRIVVTFANPVSVGAVNMTGSGMVSNTSINGSTVSVDLTNVADQQTITLNLVNVNDGTNTGNVSIPMGVLIGDANGDRTVNAADATLTRNGSGQLANASNFRSDLNVDGTINSADATVARNNSGHTLDPTP